MTVSGNSATMAVAWSQTMQRKGRASEKEGREVICDILIFLVSCQIYAYNY